MFTGRTDAEVEAPVLGHLIQRTDSLEKTLMLGETEGRRRRERQMIRCFNGITDLTDVNLIKLRGVGDGQGIFLCCSLWGHKKLDTTK